MDAPVTVVADVHLNAHRPDITERFLAFLRRRAGRGGHLVLLGDLFDWWVGRAQARTEPAARVLAALGEVAASGVQLAFQAGNRDYAFDGAGGLPVALWPDLVRTRWGPHVVLLSHGDLLCSADRAYLGMRGWLRRPALVGLLRALPFPVSSALARGLRDLSDRSWRRNAGARLGIDYGLARAWLRAAGADRLVLGHVHTGVHHRDPDGAAEVLVVRDWDRTGSAVTFDGTEVRLETLGGA